MPASSIRDLVIKDDDLVIGTHGRSIWIMDDITPLRQRRRRPLRRSAASCSRRRSPRACGGTCSPTRRCRPRSRPGRTRRTARSSTTTCRGEAKNVTLEIVGASGEVIRRYSSGDQPERIDPNTLPYPTYWIRPHQALGTSAGHHRFVWDLRYAPPRGARAVACDRRDLPRHAERSAGPVRSSRRLHRAADGRRASGASGRSTVRMDPRVKIAPADLRAQTDASLACYRAYHELQEMREAIDARPADGTRSVEGAARRGRSRRPGRPLRKHQGGARGSRDDRRAAGQVPVHDDAAAGRGRPADAAGACRARANCRRASR